MGNVKIDVSLISFTLSAIGPRIISSYLKSKDYKVQTLFFPDIEIKEINQRLLKNIFSIVKESDLIGISISASVSFLHAVKITKYLKKRLDTPIVWGGTAVVGDSQRCIKYADIICIGEGEETLLELIERIKKQKDFLDVRNIWIKKGKKIIKNLPARLVTNLDKYPFPDDDCLYHYFYDRRLDIFRKFNQNNMTNYLFPNTFRLYGDFKVYYTRTTRGCPNNCTYCGNNILRKMYKGLYVRKRSIPNIIGELKWVKSKYSFIKIIQFDDDTFLSRTEEEIEKFSKMYKQEINLPFRVNSTTILNETKLKALINCGLIQVKLGVQTGSERILRDVYKRPSNNKMVLETANLLYKYRDKLKYPCMYDLIFDNPFETLDDNIKTLKLISKIPKPFTICYHSLAFFPGTEIYNMAKKEGYIKKNECFYNVRKGKFNYIRFFCAFFPVIPFKIPNNIIKFLINKKTVSFLQQERFAKSFKILTLMLFFSQVTFRIFIHRIWNSKFSVQEIKNISALFREYFMKANYYGYFLNDNSKRLKMLSKISE